MGAFLLIPFIIIRFGLLYILNEEAIKRAAYFPALIKTEKVAGAFYQISNIAIFIYLFFTGIKFDRSVMSYSGWVLYVLGLILLILSMIGYASPSANGINQNGLYHISRNPMYVAYFIYFWSCVLLTRSLILLGFVLVFQVSTHWIILSEERWCIKRFGTDYIQYMEKTGRYITCLRQSKRV